jgi:MFS family permease
LLGAVVNIAIGIQMGWRWMFFIGIIPAFFVFYIRSRAVEPAQWVSVSAQTKRARYGEFIARILRPPYRNRTIGNVLLLIVAIVGLYAGAQYVGASIVDIATREGIARPEALHLASLGLGLVSMFTIFGCWAAPFLANRIGRQNTLAFYFALMTFGIAVGFGWAFYQSHVAFFWFLPIIGFGGADLAIFTIWLPEQYETEVRASAFAFCTTMSRFVAAGLTFVIGYGISTMHTIGIPLALTAIPFAIGIFLVRLAPETKGKALPS